MSGPLAAVGDLAVFRGIVLGYSLLFDIDGNGVATSGQLPCHGL